MCVSVCLQRVVQPAVASPPRDRDILLFRRHVRRHTVFGSCGSLFCSNPSTYGSERASLHATPATLGSHVPLYNWCHPMYFFFFTGRVGERGAAEYARFFFSRVAAAAIFRPVFAVRANPPHSEPGPNACQAPAPMVHTSVGTKLPRQRAAGCTTVHAPRAGGSSAHKIRSRVPAGRPGGRAWPVMPGICMSFVSLGKGYSCEGAMATPRKPPGKLATYNTPTC